MKAKKNVDRPRAGFLTKLIIVVLLAALGFKVYDLHGQIEMAEEERASYQEQVDEKKQEESLNSALAEMNWSHE